MVEIFILLRQLFFANIYFVGQKIHKLSIREGISYTHGKGQEGGTVGVLSPGGPQLIFGKDVQHRGPKWEGGGLQNMFFCCCFCCLFVFVLLFVFVCLFVLFPPMERSMELMGVCELKFGPNSSCRAKNP